MLQCSEQARTDLEGTEWLGWLTGWRCGAFGTFPYFVGRALLFSLQSDTAAKNLPTRLVMLQDTLYWRLRRVTPAGRWRRVGGGAPGLIRARSSPVIRPS